MVSVNLEIGDLWPSLGHACIGSMCSYKIVVDLEFPSDQPFDSSDRKLKLIGGRPTTNDMY